MLSFVFKGLYKNSHIQTIHQMYSKHLKDQSIQIESIYIESKVGDILYASIHFVDNKHRRYYVVCSLIDALIMSILNKVSINAVKDTWDKIDSFDDWNYEEYIVDWSPE
jgi:bifunctional DNase/RNase